VSRGVSWLLIMGRNQRLSTQRVILLLADVFLLNASVLLAFLIRFEGNPPRNHLLDYEQVAPIFTIISVAAFRILGLYSSLWRYASVDDAFTIIKATAASAGILGGLVVALPAAVDALGWQSLQGSALLVRGFPRSVVILSWLLNTLLLGGLRFTLRYWQESPWARHRGRLFAAAVGRASRATRRVLIIGAGQAGSLVVRELLRHPELGYEPMGLVDDDPRKQGMKIHGLPVLGPAGSLPEIVTRFAVDEVIVAMPSAPGRVIREIVAVCQKLPISIKTLPGVYELIDGAVTLNRIREIQIEDLLRREPVNLDLREIAGYLQGKRVLVTGAGGSIGSELCRQIARFRPRDLLLLDNNENGAFETHLDLSLHFPDLRQHVIIADIRDGTKIDRVFEEHRPDVVFHAAAHKHVHLMEAHPDEAVKTNVLGTWNVAQIALKWRARRFVLVSTDKAVRPAGVMGATKRVAEMVVQALDAKRRQQDPEGTRFVAVRFGNVLGSRGSVVHVFREQIAHGGPVTITHPEMRRYFMTLQEAVQLVIQAGAMGEGGEVFVLDMGQPVRITELAENLIRLSGYEPGVDIPIVFIGPRPGEKLFEEFRTSGEEAATTRHQRIYVSRLEPVEANWLELKLRRLEEAARTGDDASLIVAHLRELVPDYQRTLLQESAVVAHPPPPVRE
jgi:FlaA1/EpsC-like NDP-sugar epimerase